MTHAWQIAVQENSRHGMVTLPMGTSAQLFMLEARILQQNAHPGSEVITQALGISLGLKGELVYNDILHLGGLGPARYSWLPGSRASRE